MTERLSLIKTDFQEVEKRIFPRFPYSYLTFKGNTDLVFAVRDISFSGMQLSLKDGGHTYKQGDQLKGSLHWKGEELNCGGVVQWVSGERLGVAFESNKQFCSSIENFLSIDNIIAGMRPLHQSGLDLELPSNLKYWLQSDGPVEVFIWRHNDGEVSRFQVLMMDRFVEYEDGKGLKSGRVVTKRDLDTPLFSEDEFVFRMDEMLNEGSLKFAQDIAKRIPENFLPLEAHEYLCLKLGSANS